MITDWFSTREVTMDDLPDIALYLNRDLAKTIRNIHPITNWQITEKDGAINALWKQADRRNWLVRAGCPGKTQAW